MVDLRSAGWKDGEDGYVALNDLPQGAEVIDLGYRPRALQAVLHAKLKRFNVLVCHGRFGKTVFSIMEMIE